MTYPNLTIITGDLLKSDCDVIIHQANCFNVMGAGLAKQIKNTYPGAFDADRDYSIPVGHKARLGQYSEYIDNVRDVRIINLYSQYRYGRHQQHTNYRAMEQALSKICQSLDSTKSYKIGMPYIIGAGLAGGDPQTLLSLLNDVAAKANCQFYLYQLEKE